MEVCYEEESWPRTRALVACRELSAHCSQGFRPSDVYQISFENLRIESRTELIIDLMLRRIIHCSKSLLHARLVRGKIY
jgi:hypothetical protein